MRCSLQNALLAILLAVFAGGLSTIADAEVPGEKIQLQLNLPKGEKRTYVTIQDMKNHISVGGQKIEMNTKLTLDTEIEVKDIADGVSTINIMHRRVRMESTGGPLEMKYDSDDAKTANNLLGQQLGGLAGKPAVMQFDTNGKLKESKGDDQKALSDLLKASVDQMFSGLPEKPVAIGDSWEHEYTIKSDPALPMNIAAKYSLKDVRSGVAYIKVDAKITSASDIKGSMQGDAEVEQKTGITTKSMVKMEAEGKRGGAEFTVEGTISTDVK
ncbi:MAG: hypothetical protein IT427_15530 [Pirellulales bacterium]|nr:hypothetical protein [Pirellulales bacterium]